MYNDIKLIKKIDTRVNFIIKCEKEEELIKLKSIFKTKKKMISYEDFVNKYHENTEEPDNCA